MYQQILRYNLLSYHIKDISIPQGLFVSLVIFIVKHGYVQKASDWKYSSIHRYIQKGIITSDWACSDTLHTTNQFGE
ncbi:TPA: hypothetical protein F8R96_15510 [Legionella pneumophila]|nr:hypothetical protein [Legionella pneumophila]